LENDINKDIGLKLDILILSSVFKIGITVEYFNLDGKEPGQEIPMFITLLLRSDVLQLGT